MPSVDAVSEESELSSNPLVLEKAAPVIDMTYFEPPELTEALLNTTVLLDPTDPFQEKLQNRLLRKVWLLHFVCVSRIWTVLTSIVGSLN